jgi:FkbM family methyltransferase
MTPHQNALADALPSPSLLGYYKLLLSIRPAQLGSIAKAFLRVRRRTVKSSAGVKYWIDPVSLLGFALLSEGCHEPALTRLIQILLRPGDVFVDVGGNEGYFSMLASQSVQNGKVICIEPQQRLVPIIKYNVEINDARSVDIHHVALSDKRGEAELYLRPSSLSGASSLYKHWRLGAARETVKTQRLDDLLRSVNVSRIRLIKVDCEGAERLVLAGAAETLQKQMVDFWVVDYHREIAGVDECERAHALLSDSGYRLAKHQGLCIYSIPERQCELTALGIVDFVEHWSDPT